MSFRCYAHLEQRREPNKHFLHQVRLLAVLLDDPVRTAIGLEKRSGINLPFNGVVSFVPVGNDVHVNLLLSSQNALGESIPSRRTIHFHKGTQGQLAEDTFWRPLTEGIVDEVLIDRATVYEIGDMDYKGELFGLRFCLREGDRNPFYAIADGYLHENSLTLRQRGTKVYFNREVESLDREAVRDLVCDVTALLQLGYELHSSSDPKVAGMALMLQRMLANAERAPPSDPERMRRLLESRVEE